MNENIIIRDETPADEHEGVPPEVFHAFSFDGHNPQGSVEFHQGFRADG